MSDSIAWLEEVRHDVDTLRKASTQATEKAINYLYESMLDRARRDPQWSDLADHIEVWSQDGNLVIGVRDNEFVSQASMLEYGDPQHPPVPLFRANAEADAARAADIMTEHMESIFGWNL